MSYDTSIVIYTGLRRVTVEDVGNMTSNVGAMYRRAMPWREGMPGQYNGRPHEEPEQRDGLTGLSGMRCSDALEVIDEGIRYMVEHSDEMRDLEPDNGWGSYEGAFRYLRKLRDACARHPDAYVGVGW